AYLRTLPWHVSQVKIPWYLFGTAGNLRQPRSVVRGCRMRENILSRNNRDWHAKGVVRSSRVLRLLIHGHLVIGRTIAPLADAPAIDAGPFLPDRLRAREGEMILVQNHYNLQSREQFDHKAAKPDPETGRPAAKYTESYFETTEAFANGVRDDFLYRKHASLFDELKRSSDGRAPRSAPAPGQPTACGAAELV
ncbi:MAG TPA: hypothetical protein VMS93_13385, partial [Candidatus Saccharimonadales bacterium]|nr:hypothetical protein [Candidatus Saccharimonadales bacterium]